MGDLRFVEPGLISAYNPEEHGHQPYYYDLPHLPFGTSFTVRDFRLATAEQGNK
jgi:hypothetical protein